MLVGLGYFLYETIMDPIRYEQAKEKQHSKVIERLIQIRSVQLAYREEYGTYAHDWDELLRFANEDSITIITTIGDPDRTDADVRRDTNYVMVRDTLFADNFPIDSLPYVPGSGENAKFSMKTDTIERGGIQVPVFLVEDTDPFDSEHVLRVGSLQESSTTGNW